MVFPLIALLAKLAAGAGSAATGTGSALASGAASGATSGLGGAASALTGANAGTAGLKALGLMADSASATAGNGVNIMAPSLLSAQGFGEVPGNAAVYPNGLAASAPQETVNLPLENQGFIQKIGNGLADFQRGYNENLNNAFNPNNFNNNQFSETVQPDNTKLADYQRVLRNKKDDNGNQLYSNEVINAISQGKNSGNKEIADWINSNPDAFPTTKTYDKGLWGKVGEGFGSAMRFANSPAGQFILNGAVGAMSGNPMFALASAANGAGTRAKNDIYNQALQKYGINPGNGLFYNINEKDLAALSDADYQRRREEYWDGLLAQKQLEEERKLQADQEKKRVNDEKIALQKDKLQWQKDKSVNQNGGKGGGKTDDTKKDNKTDELFVEGETPSGRRVKVPVSKVKEFKSMGGEIVG